MHAQCVYVFRMVLTVSSIDQLIVVMETFCFLWRKNWIFLYYLDELLLQMTDWMEEGSKALLWRDKAVTFVETTVEAKCHVDNKDM
jgi:hypothetical protein